MRPIGMNDKTPALSVRDLGKRFYRTHDKGRTIKSFVLGQLMRRQKREEFWALRGVNFSVFPGETFGIIGSNGAGKSTLLSLIAQTTAATEGTLEIHGKVSSLLELGAGFHPDLTGRENVFLNASILGLTRKQTLEKYDEIVDLAGIGDAMDSPVKFYSSGMYVRLGFAVAVMCNPDILLIDEVLAVGDESFRHRSLERIERFRKSGKTLLIVTHDLEVVKRMADRVLFLDKGKTVDIGEATAIVDHYRNLTVYREGNVDVKEYGTKDIVIEDVQFRSGDRVLNGDMEGAIPLCISFSLLPSKPMKDLVVGFGISDNLGTIVFGTNSQIQSMPIPLVDKKIKIEVDIPMLNLQRGVYYFSLAVHSADHSVQYHRLDNSFKMKVSSLTPREGYLYQPCTFRVGRVENA